MPYLMEATLRNPSLLRPSLAAAPSDPRYEVKKILGQGASADVYLARHKVLNELRVLKIMHQTMMVDSKKRGKFLLEAQLAANLKHPAIVHIYDVMESNSKLQIEMEYVKGKSLRQQLEQHKSFPAPIATALVLAILEGLDHAHNSRLVFDGVEYDGVVHRDLKPENILLRDDGQPVICDFGVAKLGVGLMTQTQHISGSVAYMAPERLRGEPTSRSIDIFAMGIIFFELLKGCRPFPGSNSTQVIENILKWNIRDVEADLGELDPSIIRIVQKAVARKPKDRYQNAREMMDALRPVYKLYHGSLSPREVIHKFQTQGQLSTAEFKALLPDATPLHHRLFLGAGAAGLLLATALIAWMSFSSPDARADSRQLQPLPPLQHMQTLLREGELDKAKALLPKIDSAHRQQALYELARSLGETDQGLAEAMLLVNRALDHSTHPLVLLLRADLFYKQGMFNLAKEDLNRLDPWLEKLGVPSRSRYHWLVAQVLLQEERSPEVEDRIRASLESYLDLAGGLPERREETSRAQKLLARLR